MRPVYERLEAQLQVLTSFAADTIHVALVEAAEECGIPQNANYNGASQDGVSFMQFTIRDGVRHSVAAAYLRGAGANLEVVTGAQAQRLLFSGTRCIGVEWPTGRAHAEQVVVCGGTIGSAQLLLLSGIGPADHLRDVGVDVIADLPGVGENLHDHLLSPVIFSAERQIGPPARGCLRARRISSGARGRTPGARHPADPLHGPDVRGVDVRPGERLYAAGRARAPQSRGTLRLTGPSVADPVALDPNILACEADLESLVAAVELCRRIGAAESLREWGSRSSTRAP